ncbi:MAG: hypothetical protein R3F56_16265 [Planctomycetota bacterium]
MRVATQRTGPGAAAHPDPRGWGLIGAGAGIYTYFDPALELPHLTSHFLITNCFITNNAVGIGADSFVQAEYPRMDVIQRLRIINNTVAWNRIGVWSGNTRLGAPLATPHGGIYFFDLPGPWPRPVCNIFAAGYPTWFVHVQGSPDGEVGDYTMGTAFGSTSPPLIATRNWQSFIFGWKPFMRGLECDFTPHLVPDLHPYWGGLMADPLAVPQFANDIYGCNPWFDDPLEAAPAPNFPSRQRFDNPALFHNYATPMYTASTSWSPQMGSPMYVRDATLNPPGTYPIGTPWSTGTVGPWTLFPSQILGPYAPCGGTSPFAYDVNVWGFGDAPVGCPDQVPFGSPPLLVSALRFNCEWQGTNLQTFLGIRTPPPVEGLGARGTQFRQAAGSSVSPSPRPTREQLGRIVDEVMRR